MVVGIIGKARSGKDTIADHLIDGYNFEKYWFAKPIKESCKHIFGFTDDQCYGELKDVIDHRWGITPRKAFQVMGTEIFQYGISEYIPELGHVGRKWWVKRFQMWYEDEMVVRGGLLDLDDPNYKPFHIVLPDVRFQHEVDVLKEMGAIILKVERDSIISTDPHPSEIELEKITGYDKLFKNSGTLDDLYNEVDEYIQNWSGVEKKREKIKLTSEELLNFDFTGGSVWVLRGETYKHVETTRTDQFSDGPSWDIITQRESDHKYFKWNCWDAGDHNGYIMSDGDEYEIQEVVMKTTQKNIYE